MSVYVDWLMHYPHPKPHLRLSCRLVADTPEEAAAFLRDNRSPRNQFKAAYRDHNGTIHLTSASRERAVNAGAVQISWFEMNALIRSKNTPILATDRAIRWPVRT